MPERFLDEEGKVRDDPLLSSTWGYGRRICPGRHFAEMTLFIFTASLLSVFNIEKGKDVGGTCASYEFTGAALKYVHYNCNP